MLRPIISLFAGFTCLALCACGAEPQADATVTPSLARDSEHYFDDHEGYSILLPEGWEPEKHSSASVKLWSPDRDEDGFADNVTVVIQNNPSGSTLAPELLALFAAKTKAGIKRQFGVGIEEEGYSQIAGKRSVWLRYRVTAKGMLLAYQTWIVPHKERNFVIQGMTRSENLDDMLPLFIEVAESLQLR